MTGERLTVIVVTHDSESVIEGALKSIPRDCPVICIDNGSRDRTCEIVSRYRVNLVRNDNVGFGSACNLGAEMAETELLLFLNPDVLLELDAVDRLLDAATRYSNAAMFSPRIEDDLGLLQFRDRTRIEQWRGSRRAPWPATPIGDCCTGFADGSVFLVRTLAFRECGGFDPNIFLYHEDDDLSYRLKAQNHPIIHVHDARATHNRSTSSPPTAGNLIRRGQAKKVSEYYVKTKYGLRVYPFPDALGQLARTLWFGLTLNRRSMWNSLGKLRQVAGLCINPPSGIQAKEP